MKRIRKVIHWIWHDFNDWFGTAAARILTSMGCFWVVFALTVIPLYSQRPQGLIGWIQYVIQTIFQGAALPLLGYVSDKGAKAAEKGAQAVAKLIKEMHKAIIGKLDKTVEDIDKKVTQSIEMLKEENVELRQIIAGQADMMAEMEEVIRDLHELASELHDHHIGGRKHKFRKAVKS